MPTRKIRDLEKHESCRDPEHDPPKHMVFSPGVYEHECPKCGQKVQFTVDGHFWTSWHVPAILKGSRPR